MKNSSLLPHQAAQEVIRRDEAAKTLLSFTEYTKPDYQAANLHKKICDALEHVLAGRIQNLLVEAPPQHGKTELTTRRLPAYLMGRIPGAKVITATYNKEWASDIGRDVRDIVGSDLYQNVFPGIQLRQDSKATYRWQTSNGGIYISAGIGTSLTGRGGHFGIIDDPFKDSTEADSETRQETVWRWYTNVFLTRLTKAAPKIVINTRWNEFDLTGRILEKAKESGEEWHRLNLPAILNEGTDNEEALWPEEKPIEYLHGMRATMAPRDWLSIYQQSPTSADGTIFKREWFGYYEELPDRLNYYISFDSAETPDGGDYTWITVWGVSKDKVFVVDMWRRQCSTDVWVEALVGNRHTHKEGEERVVGLLEQYEPSALIPESDSIWKAVEPFLRRRMLEERQLVLIEPQGHGGKNKPARASAFQGIASMGRVVLPKYHPLTEIWLDQHLKFDQGRYDDAVDASGAFGRFINRVWARPDKKEPPPEVNIKTEAGEFHMPGILTPPKIRKGW